jgi:hypothetical protein
MLERLKAQAGELNINELYTLALVTFGVPYIFYMFWGVKAAITSFVISQIALGILRER